MRRQTVTSASLDDGFTGWRKPCWPRKDAFQTVVRVLALPCPTPLSEQPIMLAGFGACAQNASNAPRHQANEGLMQTDTCSLSSQPPRTLWATRTRGGGSSGRRGLGDERERDSSVHTESSAMGGIAKELDVAASEGVVETVQVM